MTSYNTLTVNNHPIVSPIEINSKTAFLDMTVCKEPDDRLTTSVYRKPTHTDQYLAYDSHHPQSVQCGIVKCLDDRAKRLVTKPSVISKEKKHLSSVLVSNGYPSSFVQKITRTRTAPRREPMKEVKSTASPPLSRTTRHSTIFKSDTTLRPHQRTPSIRLNKMAWSTGFPASAAKSTSVKQGDLCRRGSKSATGIYDSPVPRPPPFSEHAYEPNNYPIWNEVRFID